MRSFITALLCLLSTGVHAAPKFSITGFEGPRDGTIRLTFSAPADVSQHIFETVPPDLDVAAASSSGVPVPSRGKIVSLPLSETSGTNEYSIIVFARPIRCASCKAQYVEFVRQPSGWLKRTFGFSKPSGYTILGRRTLQVREGEIPKMPPMKFADRVRISPPMTFAPPPSEISGYPELVRVGQVMQYIWSVPLRSGPAKQPKDYETLKFSDQIADVRTGTASVQCQGTRDLFLHALTGERSLRMRAVYAENYVSPFPDLLGNTHATAEVWVKKLNKWVTVDAWEGATFVNASGLPLSSAELTTTPASQIHIVRLVSKKPRFLSTSTSEKSAIPEIPFELVKYISAPAGTAPGYLFYFKRVAYRPLVRS